MSTVKPTKKQLDFLDWELGVFFHFGIRTFHEGHTDWDGKDMPLANFLPTELDCEQWLRTVKESGATYAVLTAKHHDGFALWPSAYTDYSVKNTPWKNGKGDVVREFTDACRKYGIKVGLYYSPAQVDEKDRDVQEYEDFFINQVTELLTNYGKIDYLWFDGCGSEDRQYNPQRIETLRALQPDMLIFGGWNEDVRWGGNEEGVAKLGMCYTDKTAQTSVNGGKVEYSEARFDAYECDCRIRRMNWFYSDQDAYLLRSVEDLLGLYDYSVGRGGNLLVNIAPDRRGLLPEEDCRVFVEFGRRVREQFAHPIDCTVTRRENIYEVTVKAPVNVKTIVLEENLEQGEKIHSFEVGLSNSKYCKPNEYERLFHGEEVGHKRILRIPSLYLGFHGDGYYSFKIAVTDGEPGYALKRIQIFVE